MIQLMRRARANQPLTPAERALLRLLEALAYVALIGAATAAAQYLDRPADAGGAINWATVGRVCAAGAALAVVMALAKYFKAHGDPALAGALSTLAAPLAAASQPTVPGAAQPVPASDPASDPAPSPAAHQ